MKRQLRRMVLLLAGVFLLLTGCSGSGPVSATATEGDFRVSLTSAQSTYNSANIDSAAPLSFEMRIEYLGEEPKIQIGYGAWLGDVRLYTAEGEDVIALYAPEYVDFYFYPLAEFGATLRPGEDFVETGTGSRVYEAVGSLPPGSYVARTHVDFDVYVRGEETQSIDFELELPFTIK